MPAFVNPAATEDFDIGEELCPPRADGTPHHTTDTVTLRTQFGHGDVVRLSRALLPSLDTVDPFGQRLLLLEIGTVAWTFLDEDAKPVPINADSLLLLRPDLADRLTERLDEHYGKSRGTVPNDSGVLSPASSPATTSTPNRASRRRAKKTSPTL
jgi:hypothetical protein